ncbi:hypothetical protein GQ600_22494 [Phytophthora cactorum]|nr:hypothetical protein GQ600_22494 [Phytophthora cactorum]
MAKLLQESLPKTKATRADRVDQVEFVDLYTGFILLLLLPVVMVVYVAVGLTALPGFMMLQIYKTAALKRPTKSVERGDNYLGNLLFEHTDALFWHYDPIKRGQTEPCNLQFIRGSVASTTSADSVALDRENNDERRTVNDTEVSLDSYGTGEGLGSFESG